MKIAVGSDHAGYKSKNKIVAYLCSKGHKVIDAGAYSEESVDYPDMAQAVGEMVGQKKCQLGVLICGTGIGMSITANKITGVRAAVVWNEQTAHLASEHNKANIICLSARLFGVSKLFRMIDAWLDAPFAGGRHTRRIKKIHALEG